MSIKRARFSDPNVKQSTYIYTNRYDDYDDKPMYIPPRYNSRRVLYYNII